VTVTERGERREQAGALRAIGRWMNGRQNLSKLQRTIDRQIERSPIIMVAIDLAPGMEQFAEALRLAAGTALHAHPDARLTCVNVLTLSVAPIRPRTSRGAICIAPAGRASTWARPLAIPGHGITSTYSKP
jgi:hypothetical protein